MPFVVRVERSVLNRAIVETAILDPSPGASETATDAAGWDDVGLERSPRDALRRRVRHDLLPGRGAPDRAPASTCSGAGYGVVASSLTSFETSCNATVSAETALVAKEHFAETYGVPRHTIGSGGSGGAIQQFQIAQNYPGILDALAPTAAFPDAAHHRRRGLRLRAARAVVRPRRRPGRHHPRPASPAAPGSPPSSSRPSPASPRPSPARSGPAPSSRPSTPARAAPPRS